MAQVFPLDPVIRRVLGPSHEKKTGQKLIRIDKSGNVVNSSIFQSRRTHRYYMVTPATRADHIVEIKTPVIPVKDRNNNITYPLIVKYETSCPVDREE